MIKINIYKKEKVINKIIVSGHAGYDEMGLDIVCSSVSSIIITSVNAMLRFDKDSIKYEEKEGFISIEIIKHNKDIDILIINMLDLLKKLEEQYTKNIKINKEVSSC